MRSNIFVLVFLWVYIPNNGPFVGIVCPTVKTLKMTTMLLKYKVMDINKFKEQPLFEPLMAGISRDYKA